VDSKAVYDFMEGYVAGEASKGNPLFKPFVFFRPSHGVQGPA